MRRALGVVRRVARRRGLRTPRTAVEEQLGDEQRHRGARRAGDGCQLGELSGVHRERAVGCCASSSANGLGGWVSLGGTSSGQHARTTTR
eukprot:scaffold120265_cov60-Phaeocystis_antarctica.AAC.1